jgi:hypothetical protein
MGNPFGTIMVADGTNQPVKYGYLQPGDSTFYNNLQASSSQQCAWIEDSFEDSFNYPLINLTRWLPVAATALDHCPKPGAVGAANAQTCTALMGSQLAFNVPLPNHPTGDSGLIITLSQKPCNTAGACCVGTSCANWASGHLSSRGCILYGVLETEAAFNIPPLSGGIACAPPRG